MAVNPEERRYRVTAELRSVYQLVIQATSPEEAESFSDDIDWEKWEYIEGDYKVVDVSKITSSRESKIETNSLHKHRC
jgi:hypothetical protein